MTPAGTSDELDVQNGWEENTHTHSMYCCTGTAAVFVQHIDIMYIQSADHPISYLDTLIKTGSESIEATLRRRQILLAGFVARMENTRLPKCVVFGEMVGGAGCVRGQEKEWMRCFLDDLRASGINADQWTAAQT